jgi:hypothetical protein
MKRCDGKHSEAYVACLWCNATALGVGGGGAPILEHPAWVMFLSSLNIGVVRAMYVLVPQDSSFC